MPRPLTKNQGPTYIGNDQAPFYLPPWDPRTAPFYLDQFNVFALSKGKQSKSWGAAGSTFTNDLAATDANPSEVSSVAYSGGFIADDVGKTLTISAGTEWVAGDYTIVSVGGGNATLDRQANTPGTAATAGSGIMHEPNVSTYIPLASPAVAADTTLTFSLANAAKFCIGQAIALYDSAAALGQVVQVQSVNLGTGAVGIMPRVKTAFPINTTKVSPLWQMTGTNHQWGYIPQSAWGYWIANAKHIDYATGLNLIGTTAEQMETNSTVSGHNLVPDGWDLVTEGDIDGHFTATAYDARSRVPYAITGKGAQWTTTAGAAAGCGIQLTTAVPVRAGERYVASAFIKTSVASRYVDFVVIDSDTSAVIAQLSATDKVGYASRGGGLTFCKATLAFTVPFGTANIKLQVLNVTASVATNIHVDAVRLVRARHDPYVDRYILEHPAANRTAGVSPVGKINPIVIVGDSHTADGDTTPHDPVTAATAPYLIKQAIQARLGTDVPVYNCSHTGYKIDELLALFDAEVRPLRPSYVIIGWSGSNDMGSAGYVGATVAGFLDQYIAKCRAIGAIPIVVGVAATFVESGGATGSYTLTNAHDLNELCRAKVHAYNPLA